MNYPAIEKPTEPGRMYWFRRDGFQRWSTHWCFADAAGKPATDVVPQIKGEWRGPIPEPTE